MLLRDYFLGRRFYYNASHCDGTGTGDDSCLPCAQFESCPDGFYFSFDNCDGTGTTDDACVACTAAGACPAGHYHDPALCDGTGVADSACQPCRSEGFCPHGTYHNATMCAADGSGSVDTCTTCSVYGTCAPGSYFKEDACDGGTGTADTCTPCSATCPLGQWKDLAHCSTVARLANGTALRNVNGGEFRNATSDWCRDCPTTCDAGYYYNASGCPLGASSASVDVPAGGEFNETCMECATTCDAGFYLSTAHCLGYGDSDDACQPCLGAGECPAGYYYDVSLSVCDGTSVGGGADSDDAATGAAASCLPCTTLGNCAAGTYFDTVAAQCLDGTGSSDDACAACTPLGDCAPGFYYDAASCDGTGASNSSCVACTAVGACPVGFFHNSSNCDGTAAVDSCQACTSAAGSCPSGYYFDSDACDGTTTTDAACAACTAAGDCAVGEYHDASFCDGTGTGDETCRPCIEHGGCGALQYNAGCDGTGTTNVECASCTASGACASGFYFDAAACDGSTDEDSSCVACTATCPDDTFRDPAACNGTGTTDDVCVACDDAAAANCTECNWRPDENAARCTACADGFTLRLELGAYVCANDVPPEIDGCPASQTVEVTTGTTAVATWTDPTAFDVADDAAVAVTCDASSGDAFPVAVTTTVVCNATDAAGNTATCTFDVRIKDTARPTFDNCPTADIYEETAYATSTAVVTWTAVTASDTSDAAVDVVCNHNPGDAFAAGTTRVACVATDDEGNTARPTCEFYVIVEERGTTLSPDVWGNETSQDALDRIADANAYVGVCALDSLFSGLSRCLESTQEYEVCTQGAWSCLVLTGIIAGPSDVPKALELYALCDVADLTAYGIGVATDAGGGAGGGGSEGQEYTFGVGAATAGDFLYVAEDALDFFTWFGFAADYTTAVLDFDGDDAVELYHRGVVVDAFGDVDGDAQEDGWGYTEGWAYRGNGTGNDPALYGLTATRSWVAASLASWSVGHAGDLTPYGTNAAALAGGNGEEFPTATYGVADFDPCVNTIDGDAAAAVYVEAFFNYDASFDSNSILAYEGSSNVSFYVLRLEDQEARAAVRAEPFVVPDWQGGGNTAAPIDSFVVSSLPSDAVFMTVTVFPMGASQVSGAVDYDSSAAQLLDSYIVVVIDVYDSSGAYVDESFDIAFCFTSLDPSLDLAVYRIPHDESPAASVWREVSSYVRVGSNCFSVTTGAGAFLLGTVAEAEVAQAVPRRFAGSSAFLFERFEKPGTLHYVVRSEDAEGNSLGELAACGAGYFGTNCSLRTCPVGLDVTADSFHSSVDLYYTPNGVATDASGAAAVSVGSQCVGSAGAHVYAECSNAGKCHRFSGECRCNDGFEGSACQRRSCPKNRRRRVCSNRGRCVTNAARDDGDHAVFTDDSATAAATTAGAFGTVAWARPTTMSCVCDGGYQGADCSQFKCPMSPDPLVNASKYARDVQELNVSGLDDGASFVLRFTDDYGRKSNTFPLPKDVAAAQLQAALLALPNEVLPSVTVRRAADSPAHVFRITFSDKHTLGEQHLLECNPPELRNLCESGYQAKFDGGSGDGSECTVKHDGPTEETSAEYDPTAEYLPYFECGRRGTCNYKNGTCTCFEGFGGIGCTDTRPVFV